MNYWNPYEDDFSLITGGYSGGGKSRGGGKDKKTKKDCERNKKQVYNSKAVRQIVKNTEKVSTNKITKKKKKDNRK